MKNFLKIDPLGPQFGPLSEKNDDFGGFEAYHHDFPGTINEYGEWRQPYKRELPENYETGPEGGFGYDTFTFFIVTHLSSQEYEICIRTPAGTNRICYVECTIPANAMMKTMQVRN